MRPPLRSLLFVPGTRADRFQKAFTSGADAVILDLEDSVEPQSKASAREKIAAFAERRPAGPCQVLVRINGVDTRWFDDDVSLVAGLLSIDGVLVPKAEHEEAAVTVATAVAASEEGRPAADPRRVFPIVETARGVLNAAMLAGCHERVAALIFGAEDLTAQLGVSRTEDGEELAFARSQVVLAAAASGVDAIDTVATDLDDMAALARDCQRARRLGFRGKLALHPRQVSLINQHFSPTPEEIARAREVIGAYTEARAAGEGVVRLGHEMIDVPVVLRAERVLALAEIVQRASQGASSPAVGADRTARDT